MSSESSNRRDAFVVGDKQYVDAVEMGRLVGLSRSAVLRLARLGHVPYYAVGRRWLFCPEELMRAIRQPQRRDRAR